VYLSDALQICRSPCSKNFSRIRKSGITISDFFSGFWGYCIAVISLGGIAWCVYLLFSQRAWLKRNVEVVEDTGHVWDGDLTELNNPVPRWWTVMYLALC